MAAYMVCCPGNLACDAVGGGRIIFYDFGMMDQISIPLRRGLVNLIVGIYGNDVKEVVDSLEEMEVIRKVSAARCCSVRFCTRHRCFRPTPCSAHKMVVLSGISCALCAGVEERAHTINT